MAPIRPHRKTRSGCKTCKQRRVKCDEGLPICQNCTRRGLECAWSNTGPSIALMRGELSSSNDGSLLTWGSTNPFILELMHHYSTSASFSLSSDPDASRVWSINVPKMAFDPQNHCLLHAILAFSALHIHHADPTSPPRYAAAAHTFYQQAKIDIDSGKEGTADINAALIALSLVARYEFAASAGVLPYTGDLDWYITIGAINRNIETHRTELQGNVLRSLLGAMAPPSSPTNLDEQFPLSFSTLLSTAPDVEELHDASVRAAYQDSIHFLEMAWTASFNKCIGVWWRMMSHTFFHLLEEQRPRALIILAHYCAMMKCVTQDGPWWAKKQWGNEAARIVAMLDARWAPWLGWLETQLDQERNSKIFDSTGLEFLAWLSAGDGDVGHF
ncbi:uncharacterized protein BT62DRAFT_990182 [Guyanagaster necrorhizus]|uniref:Zn(2)-C6 fungal-type domain-containing protein n=1 Tax=Guyanagaster necrorhizus TaxID=856835 RepID=A0A9P7W3W0_9AGAR|nr:uncharacterized protein BT62DRAFT_990182 [Guyanagaster necrorhizus MCA 3950]KAG7451703.1 hypothetical protein BT62DRAFT_990182 [Guyanagaster necrorhizus MCA 3950]